MTTTNLTPAGYVITDGYMIHGTGKTRDEAMSDARQWMERDENDADPLADMIDGVSRTLGRVYIAPATAALIDEVQNNGGTIAWYDWDGLCCTCDEFNYAQANA